VKAEDAVQDAAGALDTMLPGKFGFSSMVKRGAGDYCDYGAGDEPLPEWSDSGVAH
jgi:hypothetical protein